MADKTLLDIARELNLPESTLRAWRDAYEEYIPVIGEGRKRRYPEEAALVFIRISELSSQGLDRETVRQKLLEEGFPRYFAAAPLAPQRNAVASPQPVVEALATALEQIAASNRDIASAIAQTGELAAKVEHLEAERGMLAEEVGRLRDELGRLTRHRRRSWWRRILEGL